MMTQLLRLIVIGSVILSSLLALAPMSIAQTRNPPLLVFSSGRGSCSQGAQPSQSNLAVHMFGLRAHLAARLGIHAESIPWIASCYQTISRTQARVLVQSSHHVRGHTLAERVSHLAGSMQTAPAIIFVGYSWGGMLAVDAVAPVRAQLSDWARHASHAHLQDTRMMLVTIDAIDSKYCRQPALESIGNADCRSAPRRLKINSPLLNQTLSAVDAWQNIYQTSALWLRSGPIPRLSGLGQGYANINLPFARHIGPHKDLVDDQRVWSHVRNESERFLRR